VLVLVQVSSKCLREQEAESMDESGSASFHSSVEVSKPGLAQIWFSAETIGILVAELDLLVGAEGASKIAFLSTPSVYCSLPTHLRDRSHLFEYDIGQFQVTNNAEEQEDVHASAEESRCHFFDYKVEDFCDIIPAEVRHSFDIIVADPPSISVYALRQYCEAIRVLAKHEGESSSATKTTVIFATLEDNQQILAQELLLFPAIPHRHSENAYDSGTIRPEFSTDFAWAMCGKYAFFTNFGAFRSEANKRKLKDNAHQEEEKEEDTVVEDEYWITMQAVPHEL